MRYYLIDSDKNNVKFDIVSSQKISPVQFVFDIVTEEEKKTLHVRKLANKLFTSFDGINWVKVVGVNMPSSLLNVNQNLKLYRGYRPSGINSSDEGALITQIPGKVVKINAKVGDQVNAGDTLLVLEAMKMENEIKAAASGVLKAIHIEEGQALEVGVLMMEIESEE